MIRYTKCLALIAVVLGSAFVTACALGHPDQTTSDEIPATTRPNSTVTTTVAPPTATRSEDRADAAVPSTNIQSLELVGYLGIDQAQAVFVQGEYAYVGFGLQFAVVDISDPDRPQRVGYAVLPNQVLDVAVTGSHAYVATGYDGLYLIDVSDATQPTVLHTAYASAHVNSVVIDRAYAYASTRGGLRILDLSNPAVPVETSVFYSPIGLVGKVAAVAGDYAYTIYHGGSSKVGGLCIVDVSDPAAPIEVSTLVTESLVRGAAVSGDYAYLLVGQGIPRLAIVDISDPEHPVEVSLDPMAPLLGESLAVADGYAYLARRDSSGFSGYLQVLDLADPRHPIALGRYEGLTPPVADMTVGGQHAYVATGDGLAIVSASDPTAPAVVGLYHPGALPRTLRDVAQRGDYAYVAAGEAGLLVVDVSDAVGPEVASRHDTAGQAWDVILAGDYAYLADEYNGLRVIDVADPLNPVEVGFYDVAGHHEFFHGVAVSGNFAYVADGGLLHTGLRVVDISDPTRPAEVSFLPLEIQATDDFLPARAEGVAAANGYVYLAAGTAGLRVVDVSNPAAPAEVAFYDTPGRAEDLSVVGHYAYLVDGDLRLVDVSDPTAPTLVGFYDLPGSAATPHEAVQGRYAYVTGQGIQVLDVSDPGAPIKVAAHPIASGSVAVAGDRVYVTGNGLFILRSSGSAKVEVSPNETPQPSPVRVDKCETYTAAMTLSAASTTPKTGEVVTVTVALTNEGCGNLGIPQYRLYVRSDAAQPVFDPSQPEPVVHLLGVASGQSDAAEFVLRAVGPGQATVSSSASFEFHVGYPGAAYWGGSNAGPLEITVLP